MDKLVLAYLAGVIDSDGTIGVKRSTYQVRVTKASAQPAFSERICVKQVEPHAVALLHETFGGCRWMAKASARKGRDLHAWVVTDKKAAAALEALLPYLRIKNAQARNCLALRVTKEESKRARVAFRRGHAGAGRRPPHLSARMEEHYQIARTLNRVGA